MNFLTATLTHIPLIRTLADKIWWPTYGPLQPKEKIEYLLDLIYSEAALTTAISSGAKQFIVLEDEGVAQGFAAWGKHQKDPKAFKLYSLYVLPETHGKGYGRKLVEEVDGE